MPIEQGDIKLVASKVMLDVDEGGGGPTATVIPDGQSNAVFPDISNLDRTNGRVNARQLHVIVDTDDTDLYLGSNMIVAVPPDDPNVAITLFSTGEPFDKRTDAISRIEAYLSIGPAYSGYLFGNHIEGQGTVTVFQKTTNVPAIGDTLVLTKREGYNDEFKQYVRITDISVVLSTFEDAAGEFTRYVATFTLSDSLRADFPGFDVSRYDVTSSAMALKTKVSETLVADAARYYGVVELEDDADLGDFSAKAASMFTQLVPSAQVETPVADARTNQLTAGAVPAGSSVFQNISHNFTTTSAFYIGGGINPGSLSLFRSGITLTDAGGRLMNASTQVGTVDYENGILTLSTDVFGGSSGNHEVTYTPAAIPTAVPQTQGFEVTVANRALTYIRTIEPPPLKGTLNVSYRASGRWYVLRDDGSGALRGQDSSFGAGTLNPTTGTVTLTLGALPDVDSSIIYQWVDADMAKENTALTLDNNGKLYWRVNADGDQTSEPASKGIAPNGLSITWNDGTTDREVTDDGDGNLTGYGTGTVNYAEGTIKLSPTTLPPVGTQVTITRDTHARLTATPTVSTVGSELHFNIGASVNPGSVFFNIQGQRKFVYQGGPLNNFGDPQTYAIFDRGDGNLLMFVSAAKDFAWVKVVGTIDYPSGDCILDISVPLTGSEAQQVAAFDNMYERYTPIGLGMRGG